MVHQRLLDIALAEFGAKGLEGASTRGIAAKAGTAMSSITYHFGSKEGLYLAVADHVAEQMGCHVAPAIRDAVLDADVLAGMTPDAARVVIHDTLARLVAAMSAQKSAALSLFIMREQMEPTEAFERLYGGAMGRMAGMLVDLVCIATARKDADVAQIAVITLVGQVIGLRANRATVLKLLGRADIDAPAIAALTARIAANTDAILDRMIAERQELR